MNSLSYLILSILVGILILPQLPLPLPLLLLLPLPPLLLLRDFLVQVLMDPKSLMEAGKTIIQSPPFNAGEHVMANAESVPMGY